MVYNRAAHTFTFPSTAPLAELQSAIASHFSVAPAFQKLLSKGARITLPERTPLAALPATKLLLVGPSTATLDAQAREQDERRRKHDAWEYHQSKGQAKVRFTKAGGIDGTEQYRFQALKPFPPEVPQLEARKKMLERLSEDLAVREVMIKHEFVVGTLCVARWCLDRRS